MDSPPSHLVQLDADALRAWPLPMPGADGDKEERGHVLIVGGAREMPGAVILAATAALRAGAGKLTIATGESVAHVVALAMPEARVIGLAETADGGLAPAAVALLAPLAGKIGALLVGPGMQDEQASADFVQGLLTQLGPCAVVLDACAMGIVRRPAFQFAAPVILTPHAGEMAHLLGEAKEAISAAPAPHAARSARRWNAVLALKGATTIVATPDGALWQHDGGNVGLGMSGSGDVLAGIIAGLAARGATLPQAACWGVALHALAGDRLAQRIGPLGYLARELAGELPSLMAQLV